MFYFYKMTSIVNTQTPLTQTEIELESLTLSPVRVTDEVQTPEVKTYTYEYVRANGKKKTFTVKYQPKAKTERTKKEPTPKPPKRRDIIKQYIEEHRDEISNIPMCKRASRVNDDLFNNVNVTVTDETVRKFLLQSGLYEPYKKSPKIADASQRLNNAEIAAKPPVTTEAN